MTEAEFLKELSKRMSKSDEELREKFREVYDMLMNRTFEERMKMAEDALKAYVGNSR